MFENEVPEEFELCNSKITWVYSSSAFLTKEADSNVCFKDHWNIICSISYSQCNSFRIINFDHFNHLSFLTRTSSATYYCLKSFGYLQKPSLNFIFIIIKDMLQSGVLNNQSSFLAFSVHVLINLILFSIEMLLHIRLLPAFNYIHFCGQ